MSPRHISIPGIALLMWMLITPAHALDGVRTLPSAPRTHSVEGSDYVLRPATVEGTEVTLLDVQSGVGDWYRADPARLSTPFMTPPAALQSQLQWFYGNVGWMLVPAGWKVQRASIGVDGGTVYDFVAPEGADAGWFRISVVPACEGCMLQEAEGLLPGVSEQFAAHGNDHAAPLGQLDPAPSWQSRPDECSTLLRYRSGKLDVHGAVASSEPIAALADNSGVVELATAYIAMPAAKSALADAVVAQFQHVFPACRAKNGWAID